MSEVIEVNDEIFTIFKDSIIRNVIQFLKLYKISGYEKYNPLVQELSYSPENVLLHIYHWNVEDKKVAFKQWSDNTQEKNYLNPGMIALLSDNKSFPNIQPLVTFFNDFQDISTLIEWKIDNVSIPESPKEKTVMFKTLWHNLHYLNNQSNPDSSMSLIWTKMQKVLWSIIPWMELACNIESLAVIDDNNKKLLKDEIINREVLTEDELEDLPDLCYTLDIEVTDINCDMLVEKINELNDEEFQKMINERIPLIKWMNTEEWEKESQVLLSLIKWHPQETRLLNRMWKWCENSEPSIKRILYTKWDKILEEVYTQKILSAISEWTEIPEYAADFIAFDKRLQLTLNWELPFSKLDYFRSDLMNDFETEEPFFPIEDRKVICKYIDKQLEYNNIHNLSLDWEGVDIEEEITYEWEQMTVREFLFLGYQDNIYKAEFEKRIELIIWNQCPIKKWDCKWQFNFLKWLLEENWDLLITSIDDIDNVFDRNFVISGAIKDGERYLFYFDIDKE